jgi:hypothetical protein
MKKINEKKSDNSNKAMKDTKVTSNMKPKSSEEKTAVGPEEYEEDLSMNVRMKTQPLDQKKKI